MIDPGEAPFANTPVGFGGFIVEYTDKWANVSWYCIRKKAIVVRNKASGLTANRASITLA